MSLSGLVALALLSGCASEPAPRPRPVAQIIRSSVEVPRPALPPREVLARAQEQMARDDFVGAREAIYALAETEREPIVRQLTQITAQQNPARAGRFALSIPPGKLQHEALVTAVREMLARDPNTALTWAADVGARGSRLLAMQTVADELIARDARAALERIRAVPASPRQADLLSVASARWAKRDADAALAWAAALPEEQKNRVTTSIAFELAQSSPARAAALAATMPEGRDTLRLLATIGQTWIAVDANAAARWVNSLPAGPARDSANAGVAAALGALTTRGNPAAANWENFPHIPRLAATLRNPLDLAMMPPGPERESALQSEFEARLQAAPERAADWLATLPTTHVTDEQLRRLTREWLLQNPAAAETWLDQHVLPLKREQILSEIPR